MKSTVRLSAAAAFATALLIPVAGPIASAVQPAGARHATHATHATPATHHPKVRTLTGTVGPGFTISMSKSTTTAGKYAITIHDRSVMHNFHLTGPGVDKKTPIGKKVTKVWHVTLKAGSYHYQCDMHPLQMHGSLTVTARMRTP